MGAEFRQEPADMPVIFVAGDQLDIGLAVKTNATPPVAVDLTGYTFEAKVFVPQYQNPDGGLGVGGYTVGTTAATFAVSPVSLASGTVNIGLTETQTAPLSAATGYRWYFRWSDPNGVTRTAVSGTFTARIP